MKNTKDFYNKTACEWADKWYKDETMQPYLAEFISYLPSPKPSRDSRCISPPRGCPVVFVML